MAAFWGQYRQNLKGIRMDSGMDSWNDEGDDGLPDAAFTEDELAAGVQHIMRTGNPNATSSYSPKPPAWVHEPSDVEDDESVERPDEPTRFESFAQALAWAQANPGRSFTRAVDGRGFEAKPVHSSLGTTETRHLRRSEMKDLAPHLHEVLSNAGANGYGVVMRPFCRNTWERELGRLNITELKRLRVLIAPDLEESRAFLRQVYAVKRRFPRWGRDDIYMQVLFERLNKIRQGALADVDNRVAR